LQQWCAEGNRLIVCLDTNEDIYKKPLGKSLTDIDGLAMKEVIGEFTRTPVVTLFFRGSKPIDGVWVTADITVCNASIMSAGYGIGDHQIFVINFASCDIIGNTAPKVIRAASRRLNTKAPRAMADYAKNSKRENHSTQANQEGWQSPHQVQVQTLHPHRQLNKLDKKLGQYMWYAEKKCHKIKFGHIPFLPELSLWIRWMQVYRSLFRFHAGQIQN
jgi:hypothetical protein